MPVFLTVVVLVTVAVTELFEPLPIEPPVAMLPPLLLPTVVELVVPVLETLPLVPLPLLPEELDAVVEDEALALLDGAGDPPPELLVEGDVAVDPVLPV